MSDFPVPTVTLVDNRPATTSLAIADHFGKRHDHVIRDIRALIADCPEDFTGPNFGESEYTDPTVRKLPMYYVFFDGFILLVMGYTGKKALEIKLAHIAAFNAMREKLENKKLAACKQAALLTQDKYEAFLEAVESVRSETAMKIDALLHKGLDMMDVKKFGTGAIIGFTQSLLTAAKGGVPDLPAYKLQGAFEQDN